VNSIKLVATLILLSVSLDTHAQIEDLPVNGAGDYVLPFVLVEVGVTSSYIYGTIFHDSVQEYIYGEAGEAIDARLGDLGIDIDGDAGVLQFTVLFKLVTGAVTMTNIIQKEVGETLEETFERNFRAGNLEEIGTQMNTGAGSGGNGGFGFGFGGGSSGGGGSGGSLGGIGSSGSRIRNSGRYCGPGTPYDCVNDGGA